MDAEGKGRFTTSPLFFMKRSPPPSQPLPPLSARIAWIGVFGDDHVAIFQ